MATGQPGLSTLDGRSLESQSAQRMGECTRGCGTDGWLSERTREGRTVGPGILSSRTGGAVLFVSPIPNEKIRSALRSFYMQFPILTQYLHIRTTKFRRRQYIHEVYPRNCPRSLSFVSFFSFVVIFRFIFCLRYQEIYIFQKRFSFYWKTFFKVYI